VSTKSISSRPRFLVDVDGVLADFVGPALDIANRLAGTEYTEVDVKDWDLFGLPGLREVESRSWNRIKEPGWARYMPIMPGAQDFIRELSEIGDVRILTAPVYSPTFCYDRWMWLEENFGIPHKHVSFDKEKFAHDGDMLIDDRLDNVRDWLRAHGRRRAKSVGTALLWDRPWNQTTEAHPKMVRTRDWNVALHTARDVWRVGWGTTD